LQSAFSIFGTVGGTKHVENESHFVHVRDVPDFDAHRIRWSCGLFACICTV